MVKLPLKSYGVGTGKTLKYFWPLFNIMHEKVKHCQWNQYILSTGTKEKQQYCSVALLQAST